MGYESKIYIVEKSILSPEGGKRYAEVISIFDMRKMGSKFISLFNKNTDCYIYADDGDTQILQDRYGEELKECDIKELKNWLKEEVKKDDYRRLKPFYNYLKSLKSKEWYNLAILHYGH